MWNRARRINSGVLLALAAAIFVLGSGCSTKTTVHADLSQTVGTAAPTPTRILADYQPWFGDPRHINVGYSTLDPRVLNRQIQQARDMGIYAFVVDWYGQRQPFLDRSYALLQQVAAETGFHVCLMYDETQEDNGRATEEALEAMDEAYRRYIGPDAPGRQAYVTYNGRPVIFIFPKRGNTDWDQVRQAVNSWEQPPLLIYKDKPPARYAHDFDGFYAWVHPGERGANPQGKNWGKEYLENFYRWTRQEFPHKIVVGGIWPGFDDRKASWTLNRLIDRRCGKTFDDTLQMFREYNDPNHPMPFLMIATWNDYEEGTQIENGIAHCSKGQNPANAGQ